MNVQCTPMPIFKFTGLYKKKVMREEVELFDQPSYHFIVSLEAVDMTKTIIIVNHHQMAKLKSKWSFTHVIQFHNIILHITRTTKLDHYHNHQESLNTWVNFEPLTSRKVKIPLTVLPFCKPNHNLF